MVSDGLEMVGDGLEAVHKYDFDTLAMGNVESFVRKEVKTQVKEKLRNRAPKRAPWRSQRPPRELPRTSQEPPERSQWRPWSFQSSKKERVEDKSERD